MVKCAVVGATGYAGEELVRLLAGHPEAETIHIMSRSYAGKGMEQIYPSYPGGQLLEDIDINGGSHMDRADAGNCTISARLCRRRKEARRPVPSDRRPAGALLT